MDPRAQQLLRRPLVAAWLGATIALGACGSDPAPLGFQAQATSAPGAPEPTATTMANDEPASESENVENTPTKAALFPDVLEAELQPDGDTWTASVTLSSPYDTPARHADAWRVLDESGAELGVRNLTHDHQNEQPFTRSLNDLVIPDGVQQVTIEGRDQISGWGGATVTLDVPLR